MSVYDSDGGGGGGGGVFYLEKKQHFMALLVTNYNQISQFTFLVVEKDKQENS